MKSQRIFKKSRALTRKNKIVRLKSYTELLCSEKGLAINITQKANIVGNIINTININLLEKNLTQTTKLAHGVVGYKV